MLLWDRGSWTPEGDPAADLKHGKLKFQLHGKKLRGGWSPVRLRAFTANAARPQWLLINERDEAALRKGRRDILEAQPESVKSGKTLEQLASSLGSPTPRPKMGPQRNDSRPAPAAAGIRLTHPERVLYPEANVTKLDLAEYYQAISRWMLPYVAGRPIVLVRCPEGQGHECFYQKHPMAGTPQVLRQIRIQERNTAGNYLVIDDAVGLASLAQVSGLEIHAWGSTAADLEHPSRLVFDLDPHESVPWARVVQSARVLRDFLAALGLKSFVKTTGGKGLHLEVPVLPQHSWDEAKEFCKQVAMAFAMAAPKHYTTDLAKAARTGKIFIDYLRNGRGATAVVPYSPRARLHAPVATPLKWSELSSRIRSDHFHLGNVRRRLARLKQDPWEGMLDLKQTLAQPISRLRHYVTDSKGEAMK